MLLDYASRQGKQHELHDAIFQAYYGDARLINDDAVLVELAAAVGLDPAGARGALHNPEAEQEYERGIAWAQSQGNTQKKKNFFPPLTDYATVIIQC